jgi:hypothetical protein
MYLECICGNVMNDIASPNSVEHLLLSYSAMERLQDLVDQEVSTNGKVDLWPEHWEEAGAIVVWRCQDCARLYLNAKSQKEDVAVYKIEKKGNG